MRRTYFVVLGLVSLGLAGCGKAEAPQPTMEVNAEGLSVTQADTLLAQPGNVVAAPQPKEADIVVNKESGPLVEQSVPSEVVSDVLGSDSMIQQALRSAGFYQGAVDGKIGPKTKEAIKEFQRKNNLVDDGKVGPKTWSVLKTYLETSSSEN